MQHPFIGWRLLLWAVFTCMMWIGSLAWSRAVQLIFLALWITFLLLGLGDRFDVLVLSHVGGYTGLAIAACAFYVAAAEMTDETCGREVLPVGAPAAADRMPLHGRPA